MDKESITNAEENSYDKQDNSNSIRPKGFDDFLGQNNIKSKLKVFIDSAKKRDVSLDHILFYGPPGLGKTTLAQIIANETYDNVRIKSSFNCLKGAVFSIPHMGDIRKTVNINEAVYGVYADALARENRKEKTALAYGKETNG